MSNLNAAVKSGSENASSMAWKIGEKSRNPPQPLNHLGLEPVLAPNTPPGVKSKRKAVEKKAYGLRESAYVVPPEKIEEPEMFKRLSINLTGPICTCKKQGLTWGITINPNGGHGLEIACVECKTRLNVPNSKFVAAFNLDVPYPADVPEKKVLPKKEPVKKEPEVPSGKSNIFYADFNKDKEKE
jgi:hypothetical protein